MQKCPRKFPLLLPFVAFLTCVEEKLPLFLECCNYLPSALAESNVLLAECARCAWLRVCTCASVHIQVSLHVHLCAHASARAAYDQQLDGDWSVLPRKASLVPLKSTPFDVGHPLLSASALSRPQHSRFPLPATDDPHSLAALVLGCFFLWHAYDHMYVRLQEYKQFTELCVKSFEELLS